MADTFDLKPVQRYSMQNGNYSARLVWDEAGDLVKHADYVALESRLSAMAKELEQATGEYVTLEKSTAQVLGAATGTIADLHERLALYIEGKCACTPTATGQHFPGCPMVAQGEIQSLRAEVEVLRGQLHEVREIYTGMEGFIPQTAPEGYLQRIVKQMYEATTSGTESLRRRLPKWIPELQAVSNNDLHVLRWCGGLALVVESLPPIPAPPAVSDSPEAVCVCHLLSDSYGRHPPICGTFTPADKEFSDSPDCHTDMAVGTKCGHSRACHGSPAEGKV